MKTIKRLFMACEKDALIRNIFYVKNEIDRSTFITLFLFQVAIFYFLSEIIMVFVFIPLIYIANYQIISNRLKNISRTSKKISIFLATVYTYIFVSILTLKYYLTLHIPPQMLMPDATGIPFHSFFRIFIIIHNSLLSASMVIFILSLIYLTITKGKPTKRIYSIYHFLPGSFTGHIKSFFSFSGKLTRVHYLYSVITVNIFLIVLIILFFISSSAAGISLDILYDAQGVDIWRHYLLLIFLIFILIIYGWLFFSIVIRRLKDIGIRGRWSSVLFVLALISAIDYAVITGLTDMFIFQIFFPDAEYHSTIIFTSYIMPLKELVLGSIRITAGIALTALLLFPENMLKSAQGPEKRRAVKPR